MAELTRPLLDKEESQIPDRQGPPSRDHRRWSSVQLVAALVCGALLSTVLHRCIPSTLPSPIRTQSDHDDNGEVAMCPSTDPLPIVAPRTSELSLQPLHLHAAHRDHPDVGRIWTLRRLWTYANGLCTPIKDSISRMLRKQHRGGSSRFKHDSRILIPCVHLVTTTSSSSKLHILPRTRRLNISMKRYHWTGMLMSVI